MVQLLTSRSLNETAGSLCGSEVVSYPSGRGVARLQSEGLGSEHAYSVVALEVAAVPSRLHREHLEIAAAAQPRVSLTSQVPVHPTR